MNARNQLDALIDRLRKLRTAFAGIKSIGRSDIKPSSVPIKLRVEIVTIYEEYGGIDILTNLTNLSFKIIKQWHKEYLLDPDFFMRAKKKMVVKIRKPEQYAAFKDTNAVLQRQTYKGMTSNKELEKLFPVHILNEIKKIRNQIDLRNSKNIAIDDTLRQQVAALTMMSNREIDQTPIAIMLGLSERVIDSWRTQFAPIISERQQRRQEKRWF